jgi:aspartyl protease family protein
MVRLLASTFATIFLLLLAAQFVMSMDHGIRSARTAAKPSRTLMLSPERPRVDPAAPTGGTALELERDSSGQFHVAVRVNGQDARFLVDTGADVVALTVEEAERLGVDLGPNDFEPIARTASGTGNGALVTIDRLELDGQEFSNVGAAVVEGLPENLLGQSVLRRLGKVELRGDRMIIHAR